MTKNILELSKKYLDVDLGVLGEKDVKILQDLITYHSDLYYNKEAPIISDYEYDILFKKLQFLEQAYNIGDKKSLHVGAELMESSFIKVKHSRPMISLDNTYNNRDLKDFHERVIKNLDSIEGFQEEGEYVLEFKFDGLGVELIYEQGELIQAITRGNGIEGEDVTKNVLQIDNIPKNIPYLQHLEIRGEVVMPISVFNDLNTKAKKEGGKIFSNPRNSASGSLRMKDASVTKSRKLQFFAYDLANFEEFRIAENISQYYDVIHDLRNMGFAISSYFKKLKGIDNVILEIENFGNIKNVIDFEIDGLVLKVNDIKLWDQIGWTQHHPRYAIAYKFPAEILTTQIVSVDHQVGRTGTITPVANLLPIEIGGVVVKRATLHNYEEVAELDIKIGDNVFIKRAGEVIPKIISVVQQDDRENFETISVPQYCPSCETTIVKDHGKVRYYCPNNIDCPAQNSEKLVFAVGKQGFNIDGLGAKQVELFLKQGIIHNIVDIFQMAEKKSEILNLEGFKEKSVENLINSVEKAKNVDISTLLTALGISGVGKKTAQTISKLFLSREDLIDFSRHFDDLERLSDVGPEIAKNILEYFSIDGHKRILSELTDILQIRYYQKKILSSQSQFTGKKVCITGSFIENNQKISRDYLIEQLEEAGGEFSSAVTQKTDYLLAGDKAGSKLQKAEKLDIAILDLQKFREYLQ